MYRKNVAGQHIYFCLVNATTGAAITGASVTAHRALDSASQAAATGTTTELGNGQYRFSLSAADTDADYGSYLFTATSAVPIEKTVVFTQANPTDGDGFGLSRMDAAISSRLSTLGTTAPAGWINAAAIASGALTSAKFASGAFDAVWTVTTRTLSAFGFSVTVGTNNDKTGYSLSQAFPANFASLGINGSGHVSRVTLVDTTTANTDMRGTDSALLAASYTAPPTPNQIMGGLVTGSQPAGSLARFVRDIKQSDVLFEGQIVSAGSDTAILDAGATTVCVGQAISIGAEGDVERQTRFVTAFDVATNEVTLDRPWCVVPSNGADYQIKTNRNPLVGRTSTALVDSYGAAIADSYDILDTLTEDSAGLRYTAKALEEAPAGGGGGGGTIIVQPVVGTTPARTQGATIRTFVGENFIATVAGVDAQGDVIDWTTLGNLEWVAEQPDGTDLVVIPNAGITKTATNFSVTIPASTNVIPSGAERAQYRWSIRNATSQVVILQGPLIVTRAALKD